MQSILAVLARSLVIAAVLTGCGFFIAQVMFADPQKLEVTLFILGAVPIVLFLPAVLSPSKSGALHTPEVMFRKVASSQKETRMHPHRVQRPLSYVLAGVHPETLNSRANVEKASL